MSGVTTYRPGNIANPELRGELNKIVQAANAADPSFTFQILHAEPNKVRAGMLVYADGSDWNPGWGPGLYRRTADNAFWKKVDGEWLSLFDFGAVGDGVADDTTACTAAFAFASTHGVTLWIPDGYTFRCQAGRSVTSGLRLRGTGTIAFDNSSQFGLQIEPAITVTTSVTSSSVVQYPVTTGIDMVSALVVADASQFSINDICHIHSTDVYTWISGVRKGELVKIVEIVGSTIYIAGVLYETYATTVTLSKLNEAAVDIDGPTFTYDGDPFSPSSSTRFGALVTIGCVAPSVNATFEDDLCAGWITMTDWQPTGSIKVRNLRNKEAAPQLLGYGVAAYGSTTKGRITIMADRCRHAFTTGTWSTAVDLIRAGRVSDMVISGTAVDCAYAAWDTHPGSINIRFENCGVVHNSSFSESSDRFASVAFQLRGLNEKVVNCWSRGVWRPFSFAFTGTSYGTSNTAEVVGGNFDVHTLASGARLFASFTAKTSTDTCEINVRDTVINGYVPTGPTSAPTGLVRWDNVEWIGDGTYGLTFGASLGGQEFIDNTFREWTIMRMGQSNNHVLRDCRRINAGSSIEPITFGVGSTVTIHNYYAEATSYGSTSIIRAGAAGEVGTVTMSVGTTQAKNFTHGSHFSDNGTCTFVLTRWARYDELHVKLFGAKGDGTTNDTTAINSAITYAAANGIKLTATAGTYLVTTLNAADGLWFAASDESVTIKRSGSATSSLIVIDGKDGVRIEGFELDLDNVVSGGGQPAITIKATGATPPSNIHLERNKFRNGAGRPYIDFQTALAGENWNVIDNEFYGNSTGACRYLSSQTGSKTIRFNDNLMDGCGGPVFQMRANGVADVATQTDWYYDVEICHNTWTDLTGGVDGPIPAEIFSYVNLTCHGNNIDSGTRGLCAQAGKNGSYVGNNISNQTKYWAEMGNCDGVLFVANTGMNNAAFVTDTSSVASKNVYFGSNFIKGGGASYSTSTPSHGIVMNSNATGLYENWTIEDCDFIDMVNVRNIVRIDSDGTFKPKNIRIRNLRIRQTDELCPVTVIQVRRCDGVEIEGLRVTRTANIATGTPPTGTSSAQPFVTWNVGDCQDLVISDARINYTGADTRAAGAKAYGIGQNAVAGTLPGLRIEDCRIQGDSTNYLNGLLVNVTSADTIIRRNDVSTTGVADNINSACRTPSGYITQGDADYTHTPIDLERVTIEFTAVLTANRAVTLNTNSAQITQTVRITRASTATGAFNVNVGTGPLKALAAASTWCEVTYSGGAWRLTANGTL